LAWLHPRSCCVSRYRLGDRQNFKRIYANGSAEGTEYRADIEQDEGGTAPVCSSGRAGASATTRSAGSTIVTIVPDPSYPTFEAAQGSDHLGRETAPSTAAADTDLCRREVRLAEPDEGIVASTMPRSLR
jgi:hypothetical protein